MNSIKKLEKIAYNTVHGDLSTLEGIKNRLTAWFCFTFNTTPNDNRLLDMTLEELVVFYLTHRIYHDPGYSSQAEKDDFEKWLQKEMGDNYLSEEDMIKAHEQAEKEEQKEIEQIKEKLPEKITTDFTQFDKEGK